MGKIVKYCAECEEGFAEKFGFCPNCGSHLTAFELNPVSGEVIEGGQNGQPEPARFEAVAPAADVYEGGQHTEINPVAETQPLSASEPVGGEVNGGSSDGGISAAPDEEPGTFSASASANGNSNGDFYQATYGDKAAFENGQPAAASESADDNFHITLVEEKNGKQRNVLLLGALMLMTSLMVGGWVVSLFNKMTQIGAIETSELFAYVAEVEPAPIEPEEQPKKDDRDGGGGGGGGNEEKVEASKGRLVSQSQTPITPPSPFIQQARTELKIIQETQGNIKREITDERAGIPNSLNSGMLSSGTGSGGGIGSGVGTGIGSGRGTGEGSGIGSGSGSGVGNGNGSGRGDGDGPPALKTPQPGPPEPLRILAKPQPRYTDAARQSNTQGKVVLKVTFLASGQIGSVTPISGLPNGLTEQAIAAARSIRFEPAKRGGVPYSVTKTIEYTFTIY